MVEASRERRGGRRRMGETRSGMRSEFGEREGSEMQMQREGSEMQMQREGSEMQMQRKGSEMEMQREEEEE